MVMGLSPADFWSLSLLEWRWLAEEETPRMSRAEVEALARLFPDETS
jgi:hypothetical protein